MDAIASRSEIYDSNAPKPTSPPSQDGRDVGSAAGVPRCVAELTEAWDGWHLVLTVAHYDALTELTSIAAPGVYPQAGDDLTLTISPNLVPGHPFSLVDVRVIVRSPMAGQES